MFSTEGIIEVSFNHSNPNIHEISKLLGVVKVTKRGDTIKIVASDTVSTLEKLASYASSNRLDIHTLNLRGVDAEDLLVLLFLVIFKFLLPGNYFYVLIPRKIFNQHNRVECN